MIFELSSSIYKSQLHTNSFFISNLEGKQIKIESVFFYSFLSRNGIENVIRFFVKCAQKKRKEKKTNFLNYIYYKLLYISRSAKEKVKLTMGAPA